MSSGTNANVGAARDMLLNSGMLKSEVSNETDGRTSGDLTDWMSPRQKLLGWLWAQFRAEQYDKCRIDWNGQENVPKTEHDFVATSGFTPAGFYDAGQTLPLKFRKPSTPIHLPRVIVKRFTSLLFSARRHPKAIVTDDDATSDWLNTVVAVGRLWAHMITARDYGGACGAVGVSFKFSKGRPQFEVHDPRFCTPTFADKSTGDLQCLEKRYKYVDHTRDPITGNWVEGIYWYRRVTDETTDTIWQKAPAYDNEEPNWATLPHTTINHGFGECPAVWIQNKPLQEEIDGDPDCHGVYDLCWSADALLSQGHTGSLKNCDPTLHVADQGEMDALAKGSDNVIKTSEKGSVKYVELSAAGGPEVAMKMTDKLVDYICLIARCRLDSNNQKSSNAKTATEIEREYSSMLEESDILREQYGQGVKLLLEKLLRAAHMLTQGQVDRSDPNLPKIVRQEIVLPPKPIINDDTGKVTGTEPRELGNGQTVDLRWPPYITPSIQDVQMGVKAASDAKIGGLVDREHAASFVASDFQVEDTTAMLKRIDAEEAEIHEEMQNMMMQKMVTKPGGGNFGKPGG